MFSIEHLLQPARNISQGMINKQRLTVMKAYEVLTEYRQRAKAHEREWGIYKRLRGVMLADEVGFGKTFEALALATTVYLKRTTGRRNKFRVLILAAPAIQSKWEWCGSGLVSGTSQKQDNHDDYSLCRPLCNRYTDCENSGPARHDVGVYLNALRIRRRKSDVHQLLFSLHSHRIKKKRDWWDDGHRHPGNQAAFLAGIQTLPTPSGRNYGISFGKAFPLERDFFDVIIADEAHIARTGIEIESENRLSTTALRKIKALLNHSPNAYLLLLTATPFQNHSGEFKRLLELLEYGAPLKQNGETVIQCIKKGLDNTSKLYDQLLSGVRISNINESNEMNTIRSLYERSDLDFDQNPNANLRPWKLKNREKRILEGLDDYLRDVVTRNRRKRIAPDVESIKISSNQRAVLHYLLSRDLLTRVEDNKEADSLFASVTLSELVSSEGAFYQSFKSPSKMKKITDLSETFRNSTIFDMKKKALVDLLERLQNKRVGQKPVVTVFFRFLKSIDSVEEHLEEQGFKKGSNGRHLAEQGSKKYWRFTGKDPKPYKRKALLEEIRKGCADTDFGILLVSQVGNEGLDFDSFSNTIIHFDGHYNPAVMDQRNGRVYRNKNKAKDIKIYRLQVEDTYDQKITNIENEKRKLKDFYLGDKSLGRLVEELEQSTRKHPLSESLSKILKYFTVNLEPKETHLLKKSS